MVIRLSLDYESMSTGPSCFQGGPQVGVASTVIGASHFGASQFSSDFHSQTGASNMGSSQYSAQPAANR